MVKVGVEVKVGVFEKLWIGIGVFVGSMIGVLVG